MADQFVAEIRIFPFNFAPTGWALCDGQLIPISQNTALFSLLGTTYGGDGKTNFALPNMLDNAPMHWGQGPGLTDRVEGEQSGTQSISLLQTEMPVHTHTLMAYAADPADTRNPTPSSSIGFPSPGNLYDSSTSSLSLMNVNAISLTGSSLPHNNMMRFVTLNFCIALQGIFPPRSAPTPAGPAKGKTKGLPAGTTPPIIEQ